MIPCADQYTTQDGEILAANLYVAMTRARSLLAIYSLNEGSQASRRLNETLQACIDAQNSPPLVESDGDEGVAL
jgi:hypothetical protein